MFDNPAFNEYRQDMIVTAHGNKPIPQALQEVYDEVSQLPYISHTELESLVNMMRDVFYPGLSFNQLRKRVAAVLGYRSTGLLDKIRVVYTRQHNHDELHYPNLWIEFVKGYENSVFGSPFYSQTGFITAYLELLYELHLKPCLSSDQDANEFLGVLARAIEGETTPATALFDNAQYIRGFYIYADLARDKTASIPLLRDWAVLLQDVMDLNAVEALDVVAMAVGYASWSEAMDSAVEESVTNKRWRWAYA